jgi:ABC-type branched-subunit amino acid transport system substrate-binding protein
MLTSGERISMHKSTFLILTVTMAAILGISGCTNAKPIVSYAGNADGITKNSITVGGVASLTGVLTADFAPISQGVQAYFDMVNAQGGIYHRKLNLEYQLDDASSPSQDIDQVQTLIDDNVFAVVGVATPNFAGANLLVNHNVPTFGMDINPQWNGPSNLFGQNGSYISFSAPQTEVAYLAEQSGASKAAVLSYSVAQSQQGCEGVISGLKKFNIKVVDEDLNIPPPAFDLTPDVNRIKASGAQLVASCMDVSGNLVLSQDLRQNGLGSITQYWLDGYDPSYLSQSNNAQLMQGVYFLLQNAPFSAGLTNPGQYPGMAEYLKELNTYFPNSQPSMASLTGWLNADLFVTGLKKAGPNPTREKLIKAINSLTSYTAGGILPPVNWKTAHNSSGYDCVSFVQVQNGQFIPKFGSDGSVFTCFAPNPKIPITPITVPGLPGVSSGG